MSAKTNAGLVTHARACLGAPYMWGTYGKKVTAEMISQKAKQYPAPPCRKIPGLLLFRETKHVGVYIGGGQVIEAKGFDYGVVQGPLKRASWDSWGRLGWIAYADSVTATQIGNALKPTVIAIKPGDKVRFKAGVTHYRPGGIRIPERERTKTFTAGEAYKKDGVDCLRLIEINSSAAISNLEKVG